MSILPWLMMLCPAFAVSAAAQLPLNPSDARKITSAFDTPAPKSLKCFIEKWPPFLDFALRFQAGYVVHCRLGLFEGKKATVRTYLRVTPEGKQPMLFGAGYRLAAMSPDMPLANAPDKLKQEIGMSGIFSLGEGNYSVEVLVTDDRSRSCRKRWKLHVAANRSQRHVHLAMQPLTVQAFDRTAWQVPPTQRSGGIRLTILLDAAPINPYQSTLRAWDRVFLLECIYSLLRQTPYKSVRLVAFDLEQQREIFRRDPFDDAAFLDLSRVLREIETATISVQALKNRNSPEFLTSIANHELTADDPPDAVIFLGPSARSTAGTRPELLARKPGSPPFFYFEYIPWAGRAFPDALQNLVQALEGKIFQIHGPAELDQAIQKMLTQLKQE
jgi:hypothetical protein